MRRVLRGGVRAGVVCLLLAMLASVGCGKLRTEYGASSGVEGTRSIGGFGVMRDYYRQRGWRDRKVGRLSERLYDYQALVWTPAAEEPALAQVNQWFEEWLARGGKTLVYVLRDHQVTHAYWQRAGRVAPPEQRLEYRRRQAEARITELRALLGRPAQITNGWFVADALEPPTPFGRLSGPWASQIPRLPKDFSQEYMLRAHRRSKDPALAPQPRSIWGAMAAAGEGPSYQASRTQLRPLLENSGGAPLLVELTSPNWPQSKVIVLASGSLLTNFGLVYPENRELLAAIERGSLAAPPTDTEEKLKVGFLSSGPGGPQLSMIDPEDVQPTGLQMLTRWPVNMLTIPALVCGLIFALSLFPILGRPRRTEPPSSSDFDAHIGAVATLMARTDGEQYARVRISEYMVRVRGEEEGPWVLPASRSTPATSPTKPLVDSPGASEPLGDDFAADSAPQPPNAREAEADARDAEADARDTND